MLRNRNARRGGSRRETSDALIAYLSEKGYRDPDTPQSQLYKDDWFHFYVGHWNLQEFVYRFNRRRFEHALFEHVIRAATTAAPPTYGQLTAELLSGAEEAP